MGIYDYTVTKTIYNNSGVSWSGFIVTEFDASSFGPVTSVTGLSSCNLVGNSFSCSGGVLTSGSTLSLTFYIATPLDQTFGAFLLLETPVTTPEPGAWTLSGLGLAGLGWWRRKRARGLCQNWASRAWGGGAGSGPPPSNAPLLPGAKGTGFSPVSLHPAGRG